MNNLWHVFMRKERQEKNIRLDQPVSTIKVKYVPEHNRLLSDGLPEPSFVKRNPEATWWGSENRRRGTPTSSVGKNVTCG